MRIRELDPRASPEADLLAIHAIEQACLLPGQPGRTAAEGVAFHRHPPSTQTRHRFVAEGGTAGLYVHSPTAVFLELYVIPPHRRRGLGRALLDAAVSRCRALGVTALHGSHGTAEGAAFAHAAGAEDGLRELLSLLDLRSASLPEPAPPPGFRLVTWLGRVPEEHVAAYARARSAMDDAPTPDGLSLPAESVERIRAIEESLAARDRELRLTVALRDGEVAAFTDVRVSRGSTLGFTDDTGTVAAHRGLGLATAVKLESLRRLREDHPDVEVVSTTNAEENAAMRRVNEKLGFRVAATITDCVLAL